MSREKLRLHNTDLSYLVSSLRAEIWEIVGSLLTWRDFVIELNGYFNKGPIQIPPYKLAKIHECLQNDVVSRLSELATKSLSKVCFHFCNEKLISCKIADFSDDLKTYRRITRKFHDKRNFAISHKELPESPSGPRKDPIIKYRETMKVLTVAIRIMKKIDRIYLGLKANFLWHEVEKKRRKGDLFFQAGRLLPFMRLNPTQRAAIVQDEAERGVLKIEQMVTCINGQEALISVNKEWGAIFTSPTTVLFLLQYPLIELKSVEF